MLKLQYLATRPCATSHATHELIIRSLSPGYDPNKRNFTVEDDDDDDDHYDSLTLDRESPPSPNNILAEDEIKKYLLDALSSFQNVQTVSWRPIAEDRSWVQTTVMVALKALTNMNSLHIWIDWCRLQVPFHWFSKLQNISIDGSNRQHHMGTLENLARMVAQSPQLNSISMKRVEIYKIPLGKTQSLHQLLHYYPQDAPPFRLDRLVLDTCLLRLDSITIPHLKHLTSLSLTNIKDTSDSKPVYSDGVNLDSEEIKTEQKRWGSSLEEIWSVLIKTVIFLEEITVDVIVPSFITYLASYTGLRVLNLTGGGSNQADSDHLAAQFYAKPLVNHVQSLKNLRIRASHEGSWCIGENNISLISQCINLTHLDMSIISSQVDTDPMVGPSSAPTGLDVIRRVVDMVATSMPQLDTLTISPAVPEDERFAFCGTFTLDHFAYTYDKVVARIKTYKAPPSCGRLPLLLVDSLLSVDSQRFLMRQRNDGRLRYMPSPNNPNVDYTEDSDNPDGLD